MLRKAGIFMIAVMFVAVTAGLSFASDILTYRGAGANYFPTAAATTYNNAAYGGSLIDGLASGINNGQPTNVFVNPQGLGDFLVYGYYNVRNGEANVFSVTNTADYGVRARIRFKEAKESCEVLDFDICLTPHDVWHGIITKDSNGKAILNEVNIDTDTPIAVGDQRGYEPPTSGLPFPEIFPNGVNLKTGNLASCERTVTADDTLEGYFFVIAENRLSTSDDAGTFCGTAHESDGDVSYYDNLAAGDVANVLFGNNYILTSSDIYGYNATALADWANQAFDSAPSDNYPDIQDGGDPAIASTQTVCPVNFVLTKATVKNSFFDLGLGTESIVNFPTKSVTLGSTCDVWADDDTTPVGATVYDDKENSVTQHCTTSPCESIPTLNLPNEVNVVSINGAKIFDSAVEQALDTTFTLGYISLDLTTDGTNHIASRETTVNRITTHGLPTIGYVVTSVTDSGFNWMLPVVYTQQITAVVAQ